jgi:NAD(P)-dependent dehydrogenase (short-subunit alcohol dehydrogenase family)
LNAIIKLPNDFHFDFNQKRVLITGAGKGIGREISTMLHRFNAQVVALSRTEKDLQSLQEEIGCETIIAELGNPELGHHGIRVNSVNPTVVLTEMGKRAWSDPVKGGPMLARIPLGRFAEYADTALVVCFLLSDGAAMLNGLALRIDGGFLVT